MTAIIILNWNGWKDTICCLRSLYQLRNSEYFIVVVDNGSTDNSVFCISNWLNEEKKKYHTVRQGESVATIKIENQDCILYRLNENYGFAKGNNYAIDLVKVFSPKYFILLNNDTEVENNFLYELEKFILDNPEYKALTPMIRYYANKNKIWNCGGKLFFGLRKYCYADSSVDKVKEVGCIPISLITGCALFFPYLLIKNAPLLTERYFFGEEDFNFSLRMKQKKFKMACVLSSQIYHKVSSSTSKMDNLSRIYIHYLNRFIDIKHHFSHFKFFFWKQINYVYIFFLLRKKFSLNKILIMLDLLSVNHKKLNAVTKSTFFACVSKDISEIKKL